MSTASRHSRSRFLTGIIFLIFFAISLLTNMLGPLIPEIIRAFSLSLTMAAFLPFSFFVAYAFMSIPAGVIVERFGEKPVLLGAFALALAGSLLFAFFPAYTTALLSLFLIGLGMAALQVAINPLLRVVGGEENYAFNDVFVQVVFGLGSFISPHIYARFVSGSTGGGVIAVFARLAPENLPWLSVYGVLSALSAGVLFLLLFLRFPPVEKNEVKDMVAVHLSLLRQPLTWAYFFAIFFYVGLEQGLSNWISEFLSATHGFNPQVEGAAAVSYYWLFMTAGALLGLVLLKLFDSRRVLLWFTGLSFATLSLALFGPRIVSLVACAGLGFSISVMWPILFALALNSRGDHHGTFSGILCSGVVGGAVVPLLVGTVGDLASLRAGLCFLFVPLAYFVFISRWASPLVHNKTLGKKE